MIWKFHVTVRRGATFKQLLDLAKTSKDKFAYQIVAGGICSLIIRRVKCIHYERDTAKMTMLRDNILDKLSVLGPGVTVVTVQRASIAKYKRLKNHPDIDYSDWQSRQKEQLRLLNDDFSDVNSFIEEDRQHLGPHRYISRKPHAPKM